MSEISSLHGPDRVRKRPGVFFSRPHAEGPLIMALDLLSYAIQEHQLGLATHIDVKMFKDAFLISDDGGGLPIEPEGDIAGWEELFCGVFPRKEGEFAFSVGSERQNKLREITGNDRLYINWCTHFAACAASEYMRVATYRNGFEYKLSFEKGILVGEVEKTVNRTGRGTEITFKPDAEVFEDVNIDFAKVKAYAAEQMQLHPKLNIFVREDM